MPTIQFFRAAVAPQRAIVTDREQDILRFARDAPGGVVLVTLVEIRGGAARAVGAQMAVREDGSYCGYVSGGCTEAAVAAEAVVTFDKDADRYLKLGEGSPFFDIVLPCGGGLTLSLHIVRNRQLLDDTLCGLADRNPVSLSYNPARQLLERSSMATTGWHDDTFHRAYQPSLRLAVAGDGIEADVTRQVAEAAGYEVVTVAAENLDEHTATAILLHDLDREIPFLEAALAGRSQYVGALGSRNTHERRRAALLARGYSEAEIGRIKGPIGLFGPARNASSLALSILADIAQ